MFKQTSSVCESAEDETFYLRALCQANLSILRRVVRQATRGPNQSERSIF